MTAHAARSTVGSGSPPYGVIVTQLRIRRAPRSPTALRAGRPVVALESTIVSHGLPRPDNLRVAREIERPYGDNGAVPATIGMVGGELSSGWTTPS